MGLPDSLRGRFPLKIVSNLINIIMSTELSTTTPKEIGFAFQSKETFENAQRMALALTSSTIIPKEYQGKENIGNAIIALEMAQRLQVSPLMVMQNMHIIHGRPSWSSQFIISAINACGKFSPLRFEWQGEEGNDNWGCRAYATELATGEVLKGSRVTIKLAKDEGWYTKAGSKWKTMPEQMLMYRAGAFFGRIYAPEIMNGMQTEYEQMDVVSSKSPSASLQAMIEDAEAVITNASDSIPNNEGGLF